MRPPPQGLWAGPPPRAGDLPGIPISHSERLCPQQPGTQRLGGSVSAEKWWLCEVAPWSEHALSFWPGSPKKKALGSERGPGPSPSQATLAGSVPHRTKPPELSLSPWPGPPAFLGCRIHSQCQKHQRPAQPTSILHPGAHKRELQRNPWTQLSMCQGGH